MAKIDIWMPIYIGDYLGDTIELSAAEHGAYLLLLMHYWLKKGEIGSDIGRLSRVCKTDEITCSFILGYYFTLKDGNYKNKRADEEIKKAEGRRLISAENGRKGGRPLKNNLQESYRLSSGLSAGNLQESSSSSSSKTHSEKEESPEPLSSPSRKRPLIPANNVSSRIEKHRVTWNYLGLPEMRRTFPTFTEYERTDCINTATFYTDEEIEKAINNYAEILKSPDHEIYKEFEKFTGFMARGVERFIDSATPFDRCRKKTMDRTPEQEDNSKYDALMRVQE